MNAVPPEVLRDLKAGCIESANLMEWLATDMSALAKHVADQISCTELRAALRLAAEGMSDAGIIARLTEAGRRISGVSAGLDHAEFKFLARHESDIVRQWACYAVNDPRVKLSFEERLEQTVVFADDRNMSVREAAWMSFRPHVAVQLKEALSILQGLAESHRPNVRRFAIEVTRPRSVWGAHILELKRNPATAESLLSPVMNDNARYVQLAVGNWLNDAAKTQPDWAKDFCARWEQRGGIYTRNIIRRGLRSIKTNETPSSNTLFKAETDRRKENA